MHASAAEPAREVWCWPRSLVLLGPGPAHVNAGSTSRMCTSLVLTVPLDSSRPRRPTKFDMYGSLQPLNYSREAHAARSALEMTARWF